MFAGLKLWSACADEPKNSHPSTQPTCEDRALHNLRTQFSRSELLPFPFNYGASLSPRVESSALYTAILYSVVHHRRTIAGIKAKSVAR
jgi:hypothetical protein